MEKSSAMLILCDELAHKVLNYDAPLYGRATSIIHLRLPLFHHYCEAFPDTPSYSLLDRYIREHDICKVPEGLTPQELVRIGVMSYDYHPTFFGKGRYRTILTREDAYKNICRREFPLKSLPYLYGPVGPWWDDEGNEINLFSFNPDTKLLALGDIYCTDAPIGAEALTELKRKAQLIDIPHDKEIFILFSISGFTEDLQPSDGLFLISEGGVRDVTQSSPNVYITTGH